LVVNLTKADPTTVDNAKLMRFAQVFDIQKKGKILHDEFIDFTQFLAVMNFLENTVEGQQVAQASVDYADLKQLQANIAMLKEDRTSLYRVYSALPRALVIDIESEDFKSQCINTFEALDRKEAVDKEPIWRVLLHNDDVHTFDYVIDTIVSVVRTVTRKKAHRITMEAHKSGLATVTTTWKQLAREYSLGLQKAGLTSSIAPDKSNSC